jgi:hypothetical protein
MATASDREERQMSDAYFLYHSIGMYPGKAAELAEAMTGFAEVWGRADDSQWGHVLPLRQRFIDRWRAIMNAPEGTVTTCDSVTQGLHMLMDALPRPDAERANRAGRCRLLSRPTTSSDRHGAAAWVRAADRAHASGVGFRGG